MIPSLHRSFLNSEEKRNNHQSKCLKELSINGKLIIFTFTDKCAVTGYIFFFHNIFFHLICFLLTLFSLWFDIVKISYVTDMNKITC